MEKEWKQNPNEFYYEFLYLLAIILDRKGQK